VAGVTAVNECLAGASVFALIMVAIICIIFFVLTAEESVADMTDAEKTRHYWTLVLFLLTVVASAAGALGVWCTTCKDRCCPDNGDGDDDDDGASDEEMRSLMGNGSPPPSEPAAQVPPHVGTTFHFPQPAPSAAGGVFSGNGP